MEESEIGRCDMETVNNEHCRFHKHRRKRKTELDSAESDIEIIEEVSIRKKSRQKECNKQGPLHLRTQNDITNSCNERNLVNQCDTDAPNLKAGLFRYFNKMESKDTIQTGKKLAPIFVRLRSNDIAGSITDGKKLETKCRRDKTKKSDITTCYNEKGRKEKLAPLFIKKHAAVKCELVTGQVADVIEESVKKNSTIVKIAVKEECCAEYVFPVINHVRQLDESCYSADNLRIAEKKTFVLKKNISKDTTFKALKYAVENYSLLIDKSNCTTHPKMSRLTSAEIKKELRTLRQQMSKELYLKSRTVLAADKHVQKDNSSLGQCWTEKYFPSCSSDIVGNAHNVAKLKEWLEGHKQTRRRLTADDSEDDFLSSDDSNGSANIKKKVALITGPSGCGKTCAVYIVAQELGLKVLEVNAGVNRNGKKLLAELLESTQSHQIMKRELKGKNGVVKQKTEENNANASVMSVILIEDADVLFDDCDDGYLSAISSLTDLSKRPIIFVANNANCKHFQQYNVAPNLVLNFKHCSWSDLRARLQVIALTEGIKLCSRELNYLWYVAGNDIRRNLLQLQMMLVPYNKEIKMWPFVIDTVPLDWIHYMARSSDDCSTTSEPTSVVKMQQYHNFTEHLSLQNLLIPSADLNREASKKILDYVSGSVDTEYYLIDNTRTEIFNQYQNLLFSVFSIDESTFHLEELVTQKRLEKMVINTDHKALENIIPKCSHRIAGFLDYLPAIRSIARSESVRLATSSKRTSRYFNYLRSVDVNCNDAELRGLRNSLNFYL